jgi:hypothetical protein
MNNRFHVSSNKPRTLIRRQTRYQQKVGIRGKFETFFCSVPDPDPPDRIHVFLGLPDPDPLVRDMDPDPSIIKQI